LLRSEIKCEQVILKKVLINQCVKYGFNSFLGKCWISPTDNGLEVGASEDSRLFFNVTEFLSLDMNLSGTGGLVASSNSHIVGHEMTGKGT
jgi:hypothetical protein